MVSHFRMPLGHWTRETVPNFWDRFAPLFRVLGVSRSAVSLRVLVTPFCSFGFGVQVKSVTQPTNLQINKFSPLKSWLSTII